MRDLAGARVYAWANASVVSDRRRADASDVASGQEVRVGAAPRIDQPRRRERQRDQHGGCDHGSLDPSPGVGGGAPAPRLDPLP
jgi:hypothetical protein